MSYWRMQLHPAESNIAVQHSVQSLVAGFVGLDFGTDVGDLLRANQTSLPKNQRHYWAFAHDMKIGDRVLIMAHHFPVALARIAGDYNYVRAIAPE